MAIYTDYFYFTNFEMLFCTIPCTIRMSKKEKSCLLMDNMMKNFCFSTLAAKHSPQSCKTLMQLQERKLYFFLLCPANFAFQTLLPGFFTYHLHIGAAQNVKVALKFYLTLFHFYEASLVLFYFFAG